LGAKAEKGFKFDKMSLENYWRKEIQKKGKGAGAAGPTRLPFDPLSRAAQLPLPSPTRGRARLAPPGAGHVAAVRRRRGRDRLADRLIPVRTPPRAPRRPLCPLPAPSPSSLASAAAAVTIVAPLLAELRRSPPTASVSRSPRQGHRHVRLRRGKPLRTLYRGESHPRARNRSPEFTRPHRNAPPRRNPPISASFRLFLSALGSGRGQEAQTILHARSTPPEWPGHGEQHRRAAMHASRGAPAILRPNQGYPRVRLAAGSTLVLTPWPESSPPTRSARRRCSPSRSH